LAGQHGSLVLKKTKKLKLKKEVEVEREQIENNEHVKKETK
jgi:hypothetical protein